MARFAQVIFPGMPYHVTHRGNRGGAGFFTPPDPFTAGAREGLTGRPLAWSRWLEQTLDREAVEQLRRCTLTGRPCGTDEFVRNAEDLLGRMLSPRKRGRKPKGEMK